MKRNLKVVLFSGGRGTRTIAEVLLKHPQVELNVVINAYDDGLSTGRLRRFVPGMLGPSDVRKNIDRMMRSSDECHRALRALSNHRLRLDMSFAEGDQLLASLERMHQPEAEPVRGWFRSLSLAQAGSLAEYCAEFRRYASQQAALGNPFDFADCAIGNILFAGCFLAEGRDFNRTVARLCEVYQVRGHLFNVTAGENYFLVAKKADGSYLLSEAEIVSAQALCEIERLFLLDEEAYRKGIENQHGAPRAELAEAIARASRVPQLNPAVDHALRDADIIIYGPGTQHSSLFPSYLTNGVAEAIAANQDADKLFISNIWRDFDIQTDDVNSLVRKLLETLGRYGTVPTNWRQFVTHFFFQRNLQDGTAAGNYVGFEPEKFAYPMQTVKLVNWEEQDGKHSGGRVLDELLAIVQSRIDVKLDRIPSSISIVVPVLNEERTIEGVLTSLQALDFSRFDLAKEILVVDGGSRDATADIARRLRGIRVLTLPAGSGRGEALRTGFENATGNIVVTFPGDGEYSVDDIFPVVSPIASGGYHAVFGSRAIKCVNMNERIASIYGRSRGAFLVSKYGGILLSVIMLVLYNKYVADLLTSIKAFDASVLRRLSLKRLSFDFDAEITARLSQASEFILEVPVDYRPRTRSEGKKIRLADGLKCITALLACRFGRQH